MTDDQSNYLCNDDDLNSLTDYFTAALAGEESKSRLQQMWEQEIGIIKATHAGTVTVQQPWREYFLITKEELDQIKNDCAFPETPNCDGCRHAGDFDSARASGVGCTFKGANVLMDEIIKRPLLKEHDAAIRNAALDEVILKCNSEIQYWGPLFSDKDRYGKLKANYLIRDYCESLRPITPTQEPPHGP